MSTEKKIAIISDVPMLDPDRREGSKNSSFVKITRFAEKIFLCSYAWRRQLSSDVALAG